MLATVEWLERHQVPLYLAALLVGVGVGLGFEGVAAPAGHAVNPVLAQLLYATFLAITFPQLVGGAADRLLAATPLLMLAQMALLPVYLRMMVGRASRRRWTWAHSSGRSCC